MEKHVIKVYVGTDRLYQDEFLRGDHPATLFKASIATPSLEAAVINSKYINSNPLDRIARDFQENGLNLSKQTISNWTIWSVERYFLPLYEWMKNMPDSAIKKDILTATDRSTQNPHDK